jgi:O-antigen/teichoic acid export membrane protein
LNNIRLLMNPIYEERKIEGDFGLLFLVACFIDIVGTLVFWKIYKFEISASLLFFTICLTLLVSSYEYYSVCFRIKLDFKKTFISNIFLCGGYILGYGIFCKTNVWPLVYILGYAFSMLYISKNCRLWKEKLCRTDLFKRTLSETSMLFIAGIISRLINYSDKLLIYPIMGAEEVAIYYAASIIGKMMSMMISPVSNVALSYLARMKRNNNLFALVLKIGCVVGILGYFICVALSRVILLILYPQYTESALVYIPLTTASAVIASICGILNPFALRFVKMKWQIVLNAMTFIVYTFACLVLLKCYGMIGFCVGVLLANIFKLVLIVVLYIGKFSHEGV